MSTYTYRDNSNYPDIKVVFVCEASGILEADLLYQKEVGKDVMKQAYIGCTIEIKLGGY